MSAHHNPPAFPACNEANVNDTMGMTLRDWFAGQALCGVYSNPEYARALGEAARAAGKDEAGFCAEMAYQQADAMLTARAKGGAV